MPNQDKSCGSNPSTRPTASDCWTTRILGNWTDESRERVADLLFSTEKGIGLSLWRFNLGAKCVDPG